MSAGFASTSEHKWRKPGTRSPRPSAARPMEDSTNRAPVSPRPGQGSRTRILAQSKASRGALEATGWKTRVLQSMSWAVNDPGVGPCPRSLLLSQRAEATRVPGDVKARTLFVPYFRDANGIAALCKFIGIVHRV